MARYFGYFNLALTDYLEFRFYGEPIKIGEYDPGLRGAMGRTTHQALLRTV